MLPLLASDHHHHWLPSQVCLRPPFYDHGPRSTSFSSYTASNIRINQTQNSARDAIFVPSHSRSKTLHSRVSAHARGEQSSVLTFPGRMSVQPSCNTIDVVPDVRADESQIHSEIHAVPVELTIRLFELVTALENGLCDGWFSTTGVAKLMQVCRRWRSIALSTPSFWRHIDSTRPVRWISLCLERSGGCTLDVSLTLQRHVDPTDVMDLVLPHAYRIGSLYANLSMGRGHYWHILKPLFAAGMPALERLELVPLRDRDDLRYARQKTWDFGICRANMPYLRWLSVEQVVLPSPRDFWQALRVLKLYDYSSADFIPRSIDDLVGVLARNPKLEELHIRLYTVLGEKSIRIPTKADQGGARRRKPVARVHLPLLHTCSLHAYAEFVEELLLHLELSKDILDVRIIPAPR
ncbi:hypothetical protein VTO73DRAFT_10717 [Trametes versicolor]